MGSIKKEKRRTSVLQRWMINGLGIVVLFLVILLIAVILSVHTIYYNGVKNALTEISEQSADTLSGYLSFEQYGWTTVSRLFIENFSDKDLIEVQALDVKGQVRFSTTGFSPIVLTGEDWTEALNSGNGMAFWQGTTSEGERVMSLVRLVENDGERIGAFRYLTSLRLINRRILIIDLVAVLLVLLILFFVFLSNSFFINSILNPLKEIGNGTRMIATGDYSYKIPKRENDEVGDLCDSINHLATELQKNEQLKNDFISSVSHELRTPLTAIKGWSETISDPNNQNPALMEKGLSVISAETDRLSDLVEELLDFSRLQEGRLSIKRQPVDVLAELEETVLLYKAEAEHREIELDYSHPAECPPIIGDAERIRQVFINVVDNAIKYSSSGDRIRVEAAVMEKMIQVVISDSGRGIPEKDLPMVKDKFYRVDKNGNIPGSGIGLALADEVTRLHGGTLSIDSKLNVGTVVTIMLPIADEETES